MRQCRLPIQDASIYSEFPTLNTGIDEILEVGKSDDGLKRVRTLVKFDIPDLSSSFANGSIPLNATHTLNLKIAHAQDFQYGQQIFVYLTSEAWDEGTGYFVQSIQNAQDGVSFTVRDRLGTLWTTNGFLTGSAPTASMTFGYPPQDLRVDATTMVNALVSGTYANNGFYLKLSNADETGSVNLTQNIKFFSNQTHTIYRPYLETAWDAQVFSPDTSSFITLPDHYIVFGKNLYSVYSSGSFNRLDIGVREQFPLKKTDEVFRFRPSSYLPTSSYYSIIDAQTKTVIVPFDAFSKINCDISGSYIEFSTDNLYPNRFYKILIRVDQNGRKRVIDSNEFIFEVR